MAIRPEVHAAILKPPCAATMITGEGAMMHWHNFPQIWYVKRGEMRHTVGKESCITKEGSCIFVPAFCPHGTADVASDSEVISISFTEDIFKNIAEEILLLGKEPYMFSHRIEFFSHFAGEEKTALEDLISVIRGETSKPRGGSTAKISSALLRILKKMNSDKVAKQLTQTERTRINEITQVVSYVAEEISEKMTLDGICNVLQVSQAAFMRNFKKVTGMTLIKMILAMRVRYACLQLARTNKKMSAIAAESGFYDEPHLTHTFLANMGESPTQYRLNNSTIFDDICIYCEEGPRELALTSTRKPRKKKTEKALECNLDFALAKRDENPD